MSASTRDRIVEAGMQLLVEGGPAAMTTRAVSAAAGVHAPTIYRLVGDKDELLDAVVSHGLAAYLERKSAMETSTDPVEDLRRGWDLHVGFGLEHPSVYVAIYGSPTPGGRKTSAEQRSDELLARLVHRVAAAGRLAVPEERAARLVHAAGCGTVLTLIGTPAEERDPELATVAREAVLAAITTDVEAHRAGADVGAVTAAVTLRAGLADLPDLTPGERQLMAELLDRISRARP